jgi:hypothetical protein
MRLAEGHGFSRAKKCRAAEAFRSAEGRSGGAAGTTESLFSTPHKRQSFTLHLPYQWHLYSSSHTPSSSITYNDFHNQKLDSPSYN